MVCVRCVANATSRCIDCSRFVRRHVHDSLIPRRKGSQIQGEYQAGGVDGRGVRAMQTRTRSRPSRLTQRTHVYIHSIISVWRLMASHA